MQADYTVRNYQAKDKEAVVQLYKNLIGHHTNVIYWWPGPEHTWNNVYCVFYEDLMIAKGQIETINVIPTDNSTNASHLIFFNIKVHPKWENDNKVRDILYKRILEKAKLIKEKLPPNFPTKLCAGNFVMEEQDNAYLESRGFEYFKSLYWMHRELDSDLPKSKLKIPKVQVKHWNMNRRIDELKYLQAELEIWPDDPNNLDKLLEYKSNPYWKAITAFYNNEIIGSIMVWKEKDENIGTIENVFVSPTWRNHGLASHLIVEGIHYLKNCNLDEVQLLVETKNQSGLKLYKSLGFEINKEEKRYSINL